MADHTWLWQNEQLSDVRISLVCTPGLPASCKGEPAAKKQRTEPSGTGAAGVEGHHEPGGGACSELPAHATVLASVSEYWKARVLRWRTDSTEAGAGTPCVLTEEVSSSEELEAASSVLKHAYTNQLPDKATCKQLMQMAVCADKWAMSHTLSACVTSAAAATQLSGEDLQWLLQDSLPTAITQDSSYQSLRGRCAGELLRQFGRARAVAANPQLLQSFCNLSLRALQLWAEQDKLRVDSENTVAVLFTHWWDKNSSRFSPQQAAAAISTLTGSLRVGYLTHSFLLSVIKRLPCFKLTRTELETLLIVHGTALERQPEWVKSKLRPMWVRSPHAHDDLQPKSCQWTITRAEIDQLHKDAAIKYSWLQSKSTLYWRGYQWRPAISLRDQKGALFFGVRCETALPERYAIAMPCLLPVEFELIAVTADGQEDEICNFDNKHPAQPGVLTGSYHLLCVPASEKPRNNSYPPGYFWQDDKLKLKVKMLDVR